jgi:hypothetical protein
LEFKRKARKEIRNPEASGRKEKPVQMNRFFVFSPAYRQAGLIVATSFLLFCKKIKRIAGIATNYTLN